MASLEALSWGGVDVASWAIRARDLSGLLTIPARRGEDAVVAGRDGRVLNEWKPYDGREFVVEFLCRGATADGRVPTDRKSQSVFYDNMDVLASLCAQPVAPMIHTLPDGIARRRLDVQVLTAVEPSRWLAGMNATVKVAFTSASAWWRGLDLVTAERTLAAGQTAVLTEFAGWSGRVDDALVTLALGSTTGNNPVLTQVETGIGVGYRRAFAAAERITLGDYTWSPTGFTFDRRALVTDPRVAPWWLLSPVPGGAPTVRLDLTGGGPMTIRVQARPSWAVG